MFSGHARRRSIGLPKSNQEPGPNQPHLESGAGAGAYPGSTIPQQVRDVWMASSPRSRLLKTGGLVAFVLFVIFYLSRRDGGSVLTGSSNVGKEALLQDAGGVKTCTKSYDPSKPLHQYVLMIDAGSTGSRIHVYRFNNCGPTPELEHEEFKMTEKKTGGSGLSAYADSPEAAAESLDILMDVALQTVPKEHQSCSPIAVKATAGLRKVGPERSDRILEAVRQRLENKYPFPVISKEKDGVVVMDGSLEGVYAWITTNYLLGKIGGPDETPTAAVFDLGGGSTQIVFQPTFPKPKSGMPDKLAEGDHKYAMDFGGRKFELYQHSHLGYGLMEARRSIHKFIVQSYMADHPSVSISTLTKPLENPCFPPNMTKIIDVELSEESTVKVPMTGPQQGQPAQCRAVAEKILFKEKKCELAPCSFNGIHQPSLAKTFASEDVYIFSYFYDRTQPLGMPESFTLRELRDLTAQVCQGSEAWGSFETVEGALGELSDRPEHCLDLNFMVALLHTGYDMPIDREVKIAKKIKGNELGWCLGASLPLLSQTSGWKCKVGQLA